MTWINKSLQINPGSYGVLSFDARSVTGGGFRFTTYSFTDCGGKHHHNNFTLTPHKAIKLAESLYKFSTNKKELEDSYLLMLRQEYSSRGELFVSIVSDKLMLNIGCWYGGGGKVTLTRKQAKKVSGYLFFWAGEIFIGKIKIKTPAKTSYILDINKGDI